MPELEFELLELSCSGHYDKHPPNEHPVLPFTDLTKARAADIFTCNVVKIYSQHSQR
jgi:hypothetical protein